MTICDVMVVPTHLISGFCQLDGVLAGSFTSTLLNHHKSVFQSLYFILYFTTKTLVKEAYVSTGVVMF